jgi:hypothetical protein
MFSKALLVLSLISVAFATVYVINPVASTTDSGGQNAEVAWQDDGNPPTLAAFGPAMISIYAGNAQQQTSLQLISGSVNVATTSSINFTVDPTIGPDSNHYFIRFQSLSGTTANGTPYEAFSAQFTLTNMTGTFSPAVLAEIAGQSTAPLGGATSSSSLSTPASTPSITTPAPATSASSTPSATVRASNDAMGLKAGWAGLVFGAIIGVTMF